MTGAERKQLRLEYVTLLLKQWEGEGMTPQEARDLFKEIISIKIVEDKTKQPYGQIPA